MRIGIIGAGKLGCSLGIGFQKKGVEVAGVFSKHEESAKSLSRLLKLKPENDLMKTVRNTDVIFITVPDREICSIAAGIMSGAEQTDTSKKVFFHCSGALTSDELAPLNRGGGYIASFHPIQTFADKENGWKSLDRIYFGFEGCNEAEQCAQSIVELFNGTLLVVDKEDKPIYHSIACILSNYLVTLSSIAGHLCNTIGIDSTEGIRAFLPLMQKTIENVGALGSLNALTGPISRGDDRVIGEHIRRMELKSPGTVGIYKTLGRETVRLALEKGSISREDAVKLENILK